MVIFQPPSLVFQVLFLWDPKLNSLVFPKWSYWSYHFNVYLNYVITRGYMKIRENKGIQDMSLGHFNIYNKGVGGILTKKERDKGGDRG